MNKRKWIRATFEHLVEGSEVRKPTDSSVFLWDNERFFMPLSSLLASSTLSMELSSKDGVYLIGVGLAEAMVRWLMITLLFKELRE